jgi:putative endonuclease
MSATIDAGDKGFSVYILSCVDGAFYTGMTNNLSRRLAEHQAGRGSKWVARRLPVEMAYYVDGLSWEEARAVERYVKSLSRARKQALIDGDERALVLVEKRKLGVR